MASACGMWHTRVTHMCVASTLRPLCMSTLALGSGTCSSSHPRQVRKLSEWRPGDAPESMAKKLVVQAFLMHKSELRPLGGIASDELGNGVRWMPLGRQRPEAQCPPLRSPAEISNGALCRMLACKYEGKGKHDGIASRGVDEVRTTSEELTECGIRGPHAAIFFDSFVRVGPRYLQPRIAEPDDVQPDALLVERHGVQPDALLMEWHDVGPDMPAGGVEISDLELTRRLQSAYLDGNPGREKSDWCDVLELGDKDWLQERMRMWEEQPQLRWEKLPPAAGLWGHEHELKQAAKLAEVRHAKPRTCVTMIPH